MGFFPPTEGRGRTWIARMRGLGREEEDLEDTVSHLSIYLTGLDELYREQAAQLKQQVHRAEKATQEMEEQRSRTFHAEYSLAALQVQMDEKEAELEEQRTRAARAENSLAALQAKMRRYEARWGIGGWIEEDEEEEPMETHWDVGTQTEEEEPEETHWDKGTQTDDDVMDQYLPLKKRSFRIEEESP
jgi:chromosome segregation ATPase